MKLRKHYFYQICILFIACLIISSCTKYEDGPEFTVLTKDMRLTGKWEIESPEEYENFLIEFENDDDISILIFYDEYSYGQHGTWEWESEKAEIKSTFPSYSQTWLVTRLTNTELHFTSEDGTEFECEKD